MERKTLEQQLFTWENWQQDDVNTLTFYDVVLTVPVGDFPVGTKFDYGTLDGQRSLVEFVDSQDNRYAFALSLTVGEQLDISHADECGCGHDHS